MQGKVWSIFHTNHLTLVMRLCSLSLRLKLRARRNQATRSSLKSILSKPAMWLSIVMGATADQYIDSISKSQVSCCDLRHCCIPSQSRLRLCCNKTSCEALVTSSSAEKSLRGAMASYHEIIINQPPSSKQTK
ncbi:hypothetical protein OH492_03935 [Vibrio chagasii]|nr:hypothetical protein [Vibrio chagasii]